MVTLATLATLPRRLRVGAVASLASGVLLAAGIAAASASTPGTRQVVFAPFTASGAVAHGFRVSSTVQGHCVTGGVAGSTSYRCFAGNEIDDPCFARPKSTTGPLLCSSNPSRPSLVRLEVTGPLPTPSSGGPRTRPWAMQLRDGQVCVLVDAAWGGLGPFQCHASPKEPFADCHVPRRGTPTWETACQVDETASSPFTTERVVTLWT